MKKYETFFHWTTTHNTHCNFVVKQYGKNIYTVYFAIDLTCTAPWGRLLRIGPDWRGWWSNWWSQVNINKFFLFGNRIALHSWQGRCDFAKQSLWKKNSIRILGCNLVMKKKIYANVLSYKYESNLLKSTFMLKPDFALVSMKMAPSSLALASPSPSDTSLQMKKKTVKNFVKKSNLKG